MGYQYRLLSWLRKVQGNEASSTPCREPALLHQRLNLRVATAERAVALCRICSITHREDVLSQTLGHRVIIRTLALGKRPEGISRQHIRPQIAVVSRRICVARKDVHELRRAMPHHQLFRHTKLG